MLPVWVPSPQKGDIFTDLDGAAGHRVCQRGQEEPGVNLGKLSLEEGADGLRGMSEMTCQKMGSLGVQLQAVGQNK